MKRVLITGSEGFIGRNLLRFFKLNGFDTYGVDIIDLNRENYFNANLLDLNSIKEVLIKANPDIVIHCAGNASVPNSVKFPLDDLINNVNVTETLLVAVKELNIKPTFVFLSSAAVYGNEEGTPISENTPVNPLSPYALHKYECEELCKFYANRYNFKLRIARIFSAYGPGLKKQIFWDMCEKINQTGRLDMFGTGAERRDFIFIDDLVEAIFLLSESETTEIIFNVGTGNDVSIKEIAISFAEMNGLSPSVVSFSNKERNGDPNIMKADIGKLKTLGFKQNISIDEGIKKYIDWYIVFSESIGK